jgi:hypothetical protein
MTEHADHMLPQPQAAPEAAPPPGDPPRNGRGRFRSRRAGQEQDPGGAAAAEGSRDELLSEVLLLREENARLKASQHESPSLGRLLLRARALPAMSVEDDDLADEAVQMFLEGQVLRESLLAVCLEIERSMAAVKTRLVELGANAADGPGLVTPLGPTAPVRVDETREKAV